MHSPDPLDGHPLVDVSETALWAAELRAQETRRADAIFRDPFAGRLAGERGRSIAASLARLDRGANGWAMVVRTRLVDDLVQRAVADGYDAVLSLAAGLDSRPYRLDLPSGLSWVEADLPAIIEHKERALRAERPSCCLRRVALDLTDERARASLLSDVASSAQHTLVVSEGLLLYLHDEQVRALARALATERSITRWVTDIASPGTVAMMQRRLGVPLSRAPVRFGPETGSAYFEQLGWAARRVAPLLPAGLRLGRVPARLRGFLDSAETNPRHPGRARWSAVLELERVSLTA